MASGVKVHDCVKDLFQKMKVRTGDTCEEDRLRFVTFLIDEAKGEIVPDLKILQKDLCGVDDHFKHFKNQLDDKQCRYVLYDCHYETTETVKEDLVFLMWAADCAGVRQKMSYASSKVALSKCFDGVKVNKNINDSAEIERGSFTELLECATGKVIISLEGKPTGQGCSQQRVN
ncbi:non-muscle cofilin 1-like [Plectropomus leopardus]|uniref:non-muscle cofilin 1-like n=1 Tax=Plectropomus leopardus TaxID=160734 RepID=UPI001C4B377E|nr:non-muscle cofilin 1-like [Plectropomus leopardus]